MSDQVVAQQIFHQERKKAHIDKRKACAKAFGDMFMAIGLILSLVLILYVTPKGTFSVFNLVLMGILLVPTMIALLSGAPFVPTPMPAVEKMLELADIKPGEKVYDIGCGDGRMVYLAAKKYQARATGIELSPLVYLLARIRKLFWGSKAKVLFGDFRNHSLKEADVVVCYLLPGPLAKLQKKLEKELKSGARVVSYAFKIGDWQETSKNERDRDNNIAPIWIYDRK